MVIAADVKQTISDGSEESNICSAMDDLWSDVLTGATCFTGKYMKASRLRK